MKKKPCVYYFPLPYITHHVRTIINLINDLLTLNADIQVFKNKNFQK